MNNTNGINNESVHVFLDTILGEKFRRNEEKNVLRLMVENHGLHSRIIPILTRKQSDRLWFG